MSTTRRYLFAAYAELEHLDFEHLEKVCDRIFILTPENLSSIPFPLVRRLQRLGKGVKWIAVNDTDAANLPLQLAFLMGRLHQKLPTDIEFGILSDNAGFDALVQFILDKQRPCFRILISKIKQDLTQRDAPAEQVEMPRVTIVESAATQKPATIAEFQEMKKVVFSPENGDHGNDRSAPLADLPVEEHAIRHTASEVIERLVRSGNRPAEVATLKQYIALFGKNLSPAATEKVMTFMATNNDIRIQEKEVVYNF